MTPTTFKTFRKRLGLTQAQAAEAVGISRSQWLRLENGEIECTRPRLYGLAMAAIAFNLPPYREP